MSEWIKVKDRMPKEGQHVDIWAGEHHNCRMTDYVLIKNYAGQKGNDFFEPISSGITCVRCATHWMPLPEPPEDV